MATVVLFLFLLLSQFRLHSAKDDTEHQHHDGRNCSRFSCGHHGELKFPFAKATSDPRCGLLMVAGCDNNTQKIQLEEGGRWYTLTSITQANDISIHDNNLQNPRCETFQNLTFPSFPYLSFHFRSSILNLSKCPKNLSFPYYHDKNESCHDFNIYYPFEPKGLPNCTLIQLPGNASGNSSDVSASLTANFSLSVQVTQACFGCFYAGGDCQTNRGKFHCANSQGYKRLGLKLGLGLGLGGGISVLALLVFLCLFYRRGNSSSNFLSTKSLSDLSSKSDPEGGSVFFRVPLFSYSELQQATSNFHFKNQLGDGGFGTVYYGKLKDGREVAVKRLHEHNYRRVKQFMNEIEILTRLHHKNLVTLYGCTSRRSRELLLVYEYIPNGTVADHLHGDRSTSSPLSWTTRMSIAVETAAALTYLHASDIIHRDVKTNNILLDDNFCVKVADFGLSRLFPNDVTHISTVPQGTPGYVDPEYHHCYQLTEKSDVYSFGVVLIELISSMHAVDISRHRNEINLADLAVNKIQQGAFDELIDPCLGDVSVEEVRRKAISMAELAFLCLQQDKEFRPSMDEVMEELIRIESGGCNTNNDNNNNKATVNLLPPYGDEDWLLKNTQLPTSPNTVTAKWDSSESTIAS